MERRNSYFPAMPTPQRHNCLLAHRSKHQDLYTVYLCPVKSKASYNDELTCELRTEVNNPTSSIESLAHIKRVYQECLLL